MTLMHPAAGLHVVEMTDGSVYLGVVGFQGEYLTVSTGKTGRPPVIHRDDVDDLIPAEHHPDVEVAGQQIDTSVADDAAVTASWLRGLAQDTIDHEGCYGCKYNAAQALEHLGILDEVLALLGTADPRITREPPSPHTTGRAGGARVR
jgi:hypothetical protein